MGEAVRASRPESPTDAIKRTLKDVYRTLAGILTDVPRSRLDLRRMLGSQLGFRPTPHLLHVLPETSKITDVDARLLTLQLLSVHVAFRRVLDGLTGEGRLDLDRTREALVLLPPLLAASRRMENKYAQKIDSVDRLQRDAVVELHDALEPPEAAGAAVTVVGPELMRLAQAAGSGRLLEVAPSLGADEAAAIRHALQRDAGEDVVARTRLNAVALRTRIERDLAGWAELPPVEHDCGEVADERRRRFELLERSRAVYRTVAGWVNDTRALHARKTGVEELRHAQQKLFAVYRELARVAHAGPLGTDGGKADESSDVDAQERLRREIEQAEREGAEIDAAKEARQQALRNAASDSARPTSVTDPPKRQTNLERERRRRKLLHIVAAVLAPVAVLTNVLLYERGGSATLPTPEQFSATLPVRSVVPALTILQAEVSAFVWDSMTDAERLQKVEEMARTAVEDGYTDLHIVDERQVERARWSKGRGAELIRTTSR